MAPPAGLDDWSPVYLLQPRGLQLAKAATLRVPWSSNLTNVPGALAIYARDESGSCGFARLPDSYTNAGFEQGLLTELGYLLVAAPSTNPPSCAGGDAGAVDAGGARDAGGATPGDGGAQTPGAATALLYQSPENADVNVLVVSDVPISCANTNPTLTCPSTGTSYLLDIPIPYEDLKQGAYALADGLASTFSEMALNPGQASCWRGDGAFGGSLYIQSVSSTELVFQLAGIGGVGIDVNGTTLTAHRCTGPINDGSTLVPVTTQTGTATGSGAIGGATVTYYNLDLSFTGEVSNNAAAVAIAPDGSPWFTGDGLVLHVESDDTVRAWQPPVPGSYAGLLVSDGTGALATTLTGSLEAIARFDTTIRTFVTYPVPSALTPLSGLASDGQGGIWVSGGGGNAPAVGSVAGSNGVVLVAAQNATIYTSGLAVASDGQIFVSDYTLGTIGRVVAGGFVVTDLGGSANAPSGLCAGDDGSVWFVSLGVPNEVGRVAHDGTFQAYPLPRGRR